MQITIADSITSEPNSFVENKEHDYEQLLKDIQTHTDTLENHPIFTTNVEDYLFSKLYTDNLSDKYKDKLKRNILFKLYLDNIPEEVRQHYNCHTCKSFIRRYGGLAYINDKGESVSVMWNIPINNLFTKSMKEMKKAVEKAKVTGVFYVDESEKALGTPVTESWSHLFALLYSSHACFNKNRLRTSQQVSAEKKEDFKTLINAMIQYNDNTVDQAIKLLKSEVLYRSEKCLGVAEWLKDIKNKRTVSKNNNIRNNLTWLAVASAPPGFCHIKSSTIGTLLDDIEKGLSFQSVKNRFAEKMSPNQYQRPTSLPKNDREKEAAEKIIAKLGIEKSLSRRFARFEEIQTIWTPKTTKENIQNRKGGIFSHVPTEKSVRDNFKKHEINIPPKIITWDKFEKTVIPSADSIKFEVPLCAMNYVAMITSINKEDPPILQWDHEDNRNPISWYVHRGGSLPENWGIDRNSCIDKSLCNVTGICYRPSMWNNNDSSLGKGIIAILEGAKDLCKKTETGVGLFPEILKSELHEIRKTIEAYSNEAILEGLNEASACGIMLDANRGSWNMLVFHVMSNGMTLKYKLDRWD
jgi:hypothetical protein